MRTIRDLLRFLTAMALFLVGYIAFWQIVGAICRVIER